MRLTDLFRHRAGAMGGVTRWSSLFASAIAGDPIDVSVPVLFDLTSSPNYGKVRIMSGGVFTKDTTKATQLNCAGFEAMMGGQDLTTGTYANPHTFNFTGARLNSLDPGVNTPLGGVASSNRGYLAMDGSLVRWRGEAVSTVILPLGNTVNIGDTSITLFAPVTWPTGVRIHLDSTAYYDEGDMSEDLITTSPVVSSAIVPVMRDPAFAGTGARFRHYGKLQYVVPPSLEDVAGTCLSITQRTINATDSFGTSGGAAYLGSRVLNAATAGATTVLDNRGTVGLLSFPIKVICPEDSDRTTHGYGVTMMKMGSVSDEYSIEGFEIVNGGKAGILGAYPLHQHMRSYTPFGSAGSGTLLGQCDPLINFSRKGSVRNSSNRLFSYHGTNGFLLQNVTGINIDTHAIFGEDGSEQNNTIDHNFVSNVNEINGTGAYGKTAIKVHDTHLTGIYAGDTGPSGAWFTNPNNHLTNNVLSRAHIGIWNSFAETTFSIGTIGGTRAGTGVLGYGNSTDAGVTNRQPIRGSAVPETITLVATSSTTCSRTGSVSGVLSPLTVGGAVAYHYINTWYYYLSSGTLTVGDTWTIPLQRTGGCFGKSRDVLVEPATTTTLDWNNNVSHSSKYLNMLTMHFVTDEAGNVNTGYSSMNSYVHSPNAGAGYHTDGPPDVFTRARLWKAASGKPHYYNKALFVQYNNWEVSCVRDFPGLSGVAGGRIQRGLFVACSLDDAYPTGKGNLFISYHNSIVRNDNIMLGAPQTSVFYNATARALQGTGGALELDDFYQNPIELGFIRDTNNAVIGASPGSYGFKAPPVRMAYTNTAFGLSTLFTGSESFVPVAGDGVSVYMKGNSGAIRLPSDGTVYQTTGWWVTAYPTDASDGFYTYGTTGSVFADSPSGFTNKNGKLLPSSYSYYGLRLDDSLPACTSGNLIWEAINYSRMSSNGSTLVDTWNFPTNLGTAGIPYPNMRHTAVLDGGVYKVDWPTTSRVPKPKSKLSGVLTGLKASGHVVVGFEFDGTVSLYGSTQNIGDALGHLGPAIYLEIIGPPPNYTRYRTYADVTAKSSLASLIAATTFSYYLDTVGNRLWVHFFNTTPTVQDSALPAFDGSVAGDQLPAGDYFAEERSLSFTISIGT